MLSSTSLSSLYFPSSSSRLLYHNPFFIRPKNRQAFPFCRASVAEKNPGVISWTSSDNNATPDNYNGWAAVEAPLEERRNQKGLPKLVILGTGATFAAILGFVGYISLSKKGVEFQLIKPLNALHESLTHLGTDNKDKEPDVGSGMTSEAAEFSETGSESGSDAIDEYVPKETSFITKGERQLGRVKVPFPVDSTQQEAFSALNRLKIIEDDVEANELCTRREYARWLVRVNSQLERSRKHRIMPSVALSGSTIPAFDDVSIQDPDFESIQSLAEAGILPSKLFPRKSASNGQEEINFYPESFISRQDLISWKAKLEYKLVPGIDEEISRKNIGFLDVRYISSEAMVDLFLDISANEKSILRRVFGQSKRFQSSKPSTKAQAAVALTSGRMMEFIYMELLRLEAESASRQVAMEEVRFELLERGDITRYWERKLEDEKSRSLKVEMAYQAALEDLEREKIIQDNAIADVLKQKAALECQRQLLLSLKEEVNDISEKLVTERTEYIDEQREIEDALRDLQVRYEGLVDAKSILEAEIEALRIMRSWIEEEARKSQSRAKVLEAAGRRWRWDQQSNGTNIT